ncbi:MAG: GyrI-like domain-containing protein [Pseudomonadota bacterium]|nr:GyrI-like domain-containing protein [Pseudomonadota bacterium]
MNIGTPMVVEYAAKRYVALRRQVVMPIGKDATETMSELVREVETQGVRGTGAAVFKYNIVKMPELEMEFGFEIQRAQTTTGELMSGILPAGRYAELTFVGPYRYLTKVNGALIDWSRQNGLAFDMHPAADGDHFVSRVEFFPNGPQDEPDPDKYKTIVAIKLKD